jgi:hypothetical protein
MLLLKTRLLALLFFSLVLLSFPSIIHANAPNIGGRVVYSDTGAGIQGILVRWTDHSSENGGPDGVRYAITNAAGEYSFPGFQDMDRPHDQLESAEQVDTDYDGVNDTPLWKAGELNSGKARGFGCKQNPHNFYALKRPNMVGEFENNANVALDIEVSNSSDSIRLPDMKFVRSVPKCPNGIRTVSCDQVNKTITVAWDAPAGGADGYKLYFDKDPVGVEDSGDTLHPLESNLLQRTQAIAFDTRYILHIKTLKDDNVNGVVEKLASESCLAELRCNSTSTPPTPSGCPGGICPQPTPTPTPTAKLTGQICPVKPRPFYYDYTMTNIDTKGFPFLNSKLMIVFYLSPQTQPILTYLNNTDLIHNTVGFSKWQEQKRGKQQGDYFGFYVSEYGSLPIPTFTLNDSTPIASKTIGQLRNFLEINNLPTQFDFKANMKSRVGTYGELFNSHIPAGKINLAKTMDDYCDETITCDPTAPPACLVDLTITAPATITVVPSASNTITVTWNSPSATTGSSYDVILYDRDIYDTTEEAELAGLNGTAAPKTQIFFMGVTTTSQVFNLNNISGDNLMVAIRGEKSSACPSSYGSTTCNWAVEKEVHPSFEAKGNIYLSVDGACDAIPANIQTINGTITAKGGTVTEVATLNNSSAYTMDLPVEQQPYTLQLTVSDPQFTSANICDQDSLGRIPNVADDNSTNDFFVKAENTFANSWWQAFGGQVFAKNVINSELPNASPTDPWRLMGRLISSISETAGIPLTNLDHFGNQAHDYTDVAGWLREPPLQASLANIDLAMKPDYIYYKEKVGEISTNIPAVVDQTSDLSSPINKNNVDVYFSNTSITFAPDQMWNTPDGVDRLVLVDGNITFSSINLTSAGDDRVVYTTIGGTTTFVASGSIIIDGSVGNSNITSPTPNLSGVFIAQTIEVNGGAGEDKRFVGEGSYYGWASITLGREFDDITINEDTPSELFIFRPDFIINYPESLRDSNITWREVN